MKILFLANRVPYPPYRGDKLKIFNLAKRLSVHHELYLLTFAQTEEDLTYKAELEKIFTEVRFVYLPKWKSAWQCMKGILSSTPFQVLYFNSSQMRRQVNELVSRIRFDAIHVQHLRMSPYLADRADLPRILDLPDAFSLYWERRMNVPRGIVTRIFERIERNRVLKSERVLHQYNMSLVCSSEDLAYLERTQGATNLRLLPNGVDLTTFTAGHHDYSQGKTLLFTGNMDYAPNVDAVIYFVEQIFPIIERGCDGVQFIIAGQRPVPRVLALARHNIEVTGFVKDIASMYSKASVVVAPLRFGAGTQNKVLEAMAMGVPVVCSNIGFGGLGIESGDGAIMQTKPQQFAESVLTLLGSVSLREQVGTAGQYVIRERFSWDVIAKTLEGYCELVSQRPGVQST